MSAISPARTSRRVIIFALVWLGPGRVTGHSPPDRRPDFLVTQAIEIWREGTVMAKLRALDRFARRGELAAPAVPLLMPALNDADAHVRARVAEVLGDIGPVAKDAIPALISALKDPDDGVSESAARAIGAFGPDARRAIPALVYCLRSNGNRRRRSSVLALGRMGRPAVPAMVELLKDDDSRVRCAAGDVLAKMVCKPVSVIPALIGAARTSNHDDRRAILTALTSFGPEAVMALARVLRDGDASYRSDAALALAAMSESAKPAIPILIGYLNDPDPGSCGTRIAKEVGLSDKSPETNLGANEIDDILVAIGEPAVPALCWELDRPGVVARGRIVRILGLVGPPAARAVPRLVSLLEDHQLRIAAADALARIIPKGRDDTHALLAALKDRDPLTRAHAAAVLGRIGEGKQSLAMHAVRFLIAATRDSDSRVRAASVRSIGTLGARMYDQWPGFSGMLRDPAPDVRAAALLALAPLKIHSESRAIRVGLLKDPEDRVRVAAVESMNFDDLCTSSVVVGLVESLGELNSGVRVAAAEKLGKSLEWKRLLDGSDPRLESDKVYNTLRKNLGDTEPRVRAAAAGLLPEFERRIGESIPALVACLKDGAMIVRLAGVRALSGLGLRAKESAPALLDLLTDTSMQGADGAAFSALAARSLEAMGGESKAALVRRLVNGLGSTDDELRQLSSHLLRELGSKVVAPLARDLCDPTTSRSVTVEILDVLAVKGESIGELGHAPPRRLEPELLECLPKLRAMMQDDDPSMRLGAFKLIVSIDRTRELLVKSFLAAARLQDPAKMVEFGDIWQVSDIRLLLPGLKDPDPDVRTATVYAIAGVACRLADQEGEPNADNAATGGPARAGAGEVNGCLKAELGCALVSLFDDPDSQVRWAAIHEFQSIGSDDLRVFRRLIDMARDTTTRIRRGATICRQDLTGASETYVGKAVDERLRLAAIECLATDRMRIAEVVPVLIDALEDGDPLTRLHAASALGNAGVGAKEAVPALIRLLRAPVAPIDEVNAVTLERADLSVPIKQAAIGSLVQFGSDSSAAIADLVDLLFDGAPELREQSAQALGQMGLEAILCVPALVQQIQRGLIEPATATYVISEMGPMALPALIEIVSNLDLPLSDRLNAVKVLGSLRSGAFCVIPELENARVGAEPSFRRSIDEAIRDIKEDDLGGDFEIEG